MVPEPRLSGEAPALWPLSPGSHLDWEPHMRGHSAQYNVESMQLSNEEGEPNWDLISKLKTEKTQAPNPQQSTLARSVPFLSHGPSTLASNSCVITLKFSPLCSLWGRGEATSPSLGKRPSGGAPIPHSSISPWVLGPGEGGQ